MGRVLKLQTAAVGLVVRAILLLVGGLILATFLVSRFFIVTRRRVGAREMAGRVAEVTLNVTGQIVAIRSAERGVKVNGVRKMIRMHAKSARL